MTTERPNRLAKTRLGSVLPETDGRQSDTARDIARGCRRLLARLALASLPELTLGNGRRADIVAVSEQGDIWIIEIKSSVADFESDNKWPEYEAYCDQFYFAVAPEFPLALLPETAGCIVADRFGGDILRHGPVERVAGARRRKVQLLFGRVAAARLQRLSDPDFELDPLFRT